jgi:hypothetical protein
MCMLRKTNGCRNQRRLTSQELSAGYSEREQLSEYLDSKSS